MADTKISALTADTDPLNADVFPMVDTANTATKKITWQNMLKLGVGVFNVFAYGAKGDGTTDDTAACQAAIDAANTAGGGIVFFPTGTYKLVTNPLKLFSGSTPTIVAYSNITLMGCGSSATNGSIIKQTTTGVDTIKALNDVANGAQSLNCTIKDLACVWGTATLTNSGNGIYLAQQAAGGPSFQQWNFENVLCSGFQASGKYGFNIESMITSTVDTCQAVSCANGFFLNGAQGGVFDSVSTSVNFISCYANMATNGVIGFNCIDNTYVNYFGCAVDIGANTTGTAYQVLGSAAITFNGCGCELDGTHTLTQMWKIGADTGSDPSSGVGIYNCYGFQAKTCIDIYVTGSSTGITIIGFNDNSTVSGSTGLKVDALSQVTEIDCNFDSSGIATARTLATTAIWFAPNLFRIKTVASAAIPAFDIGQADQINIIAQATGTNVTSMTTNVTGTAVSGQRLHMCLQSSTGSPTITWGTLWEASTIALPTGFTTTRVDCDFIFNAATSKWRIIAKV